MHPEEGEIIFDDVPIHKMPPYDIVKKRISMIPEGRRLFGRLSVLDNLILGAYALDSQEETESMMERVFKLFPILRERKGQRSDTFSGGEQQQLAIARGLMSHPSLLMLDEPSLGLGPKLVTEIFEVVQDINRNGVTVLLVEQNVHEALQISHRAYVLQTGRVVLEGKGDDLLKSDLVRQAYLGHVSRSYGTVKKDVLAALCRKPHYTKVFLQMLCSLVFVSSGLKLFEWSP